MSTRPYPVVRARLRRTRHAPNVPVSRAELVIWLDGDRFLVRDEGGRRYAEVVGDVTAARGFGAVPRTMEGLMDAWSEARDPARRGPTELRGDWASGRASVHEAGRDPWDTDVAVVAPVAEQLLAADRVAGLPADGEVTYLGHRCREYNFTIDGDEGGTSFRSDVRCLVADPFVLLREVRDARNPGLSAVTEVIELVEG